MHKYIVGKNVVQAPKFFNAHIITAATLSALLGNCFQRKQNEKKIHKNLDLLTWNVMTKVLT